MADFATQSNFQQNPTYQRTKGYDQFQQPDQMDNAAESFLQRQQRVYSQPTSGVPGRSPQEPLAHTNAMAPPAPPPSATGGVPTTTDGRVPPPAPAPQAAAAQAPSAPVPVSHTAGNAQYGVPDDAATREQFFAHLQPGAQVQGQPAMTWGYQNGSWVVQPAGSQGGPGAPGAQPNPALMSPYGAYPGRPAGTVYQPDNLGNTPFATFDPQQIQMNLPNPTQTQLPNGQLSVYQPGQLPTGPLATYQAGQIGQFQGPNQGALDQQTQQSVSQLLSNPLSLSDANAAALKERQKESALAMQQQLQGQFASSAAARGTLGSGAQAAADRRGNADTQSQILGSYRDIDLAKAQQDQADRLNAINTANQFLTSQSGRATSAYGAQLAGQTAQEQARQAAAASQQNAGQFDLARAQSQEALRQAGVTSQNQATQFDLQRALSQAGLDQNFFNNLLSQQQLSLQGQSANADNQYRGYQSQLTAQQAALQRAISQAGLNQAGAQSGLANYAADLDAFNAAQQRGLQGRQLDVQQQLGQGGLAIDQARLGEQGRQFDLGYLLDRARFGLQQQQFGEGQRQFNDTNAYQYAQLQQNGQNSLLDFLFR